MLCTQFKNKEDLIKIRGVLRNKYGIDSTIHSHEEKLSICIRKESLPLLHSIINSYIYPSYSDLFSDMPFNKPSNGPYFQIKFLRLRDAD